MEHCEKEYDDFLSRLASGAPTPGGGGASALVAAMGAALGGMVCNLTIGKPRYAHNEPELKELLAEAESLRVRLAELVYEDARAFEPLARAYTIPKDDPQRESTMEQCLRAAAAVPLEILRLSCRAIALHERLESLGSALAVSDVGTGVVFCWGAMYGAAMNVRVNTHSMRDRAYAGKLNAEVDALMQEYWKTADNVYESVWEKLK